MLGLLIPASFLALLILGMFFDLLTASDSLVYLVVWLCCLVLCSKLHVPYGLTITTVVMDMHLVYRLDLWNRPSNRIRR